MTTVYRQSLNRDGVEIYNEAQISGDGWVDFGPIAVPDSTTDMEIAIGITVAQIKACIVQTDADITLETNSGSAADETLALVENVGYSWCDNSLDTCQFATDIVSVFLTNASGAAASVRLSFLLDATP